jgi:hypothetical protein
MTKPIDKLRQQYQETLNDPNSKLHKNIDSVINLICNIIQDQVIPQGRRSYFFSWTNLNPTPSNYFKVQTTRALQLAGFHVSKSNEGITVSGWAD